MSFSLRPLDVDDYHALVRLWTSVGWIDVRQTDTPEALEKFLQRNPACNFGVYESDYLVGAVLAHATVSRPARSAATGAAGRGCGFMRT